MACSRGPVGGDGPDVEEALEAGWATPGWLVYGSLPNGAMYVIEEYTDGQAPTALGARELDMFLASIAIQAERCPDTYRDWSTYIRDVVFEGASGWADRLRAAPETERLVRRLEHMCADSRDTLLPTTDLVHGDLTLDNALLKDGKAYLVDAEFAGKGTRAYDLATLLLSVATSEPVLAGAEEIATLEHECRRLVRDAGFRICVAARIMAVAAFGLDQWAQNVGAYAQRSHALLDGLRV